MASYKVKQGLMFRNNSDASLHSINDMKGVTVLNESGYVICNMDNSTYDEWIGRTGDLSTDNVLVNDAVLLKNFECVDGVYFYLNDSAESISTKTTLFYDFYVCPTSEPGHSKLMVRSMFEAIFEKVVE